MAIEQFLKMRLVGCRSDQAKEVSISPTPALLNFTFDRHPHIPTLCEMVPIWTRHRRDMTIGYGAHVNDGRGDSWVPLLKLRGSTSEISVVNDRAAQAEWIKKLAPQLQVPLAALARAVLEPDLELALAPVKFRNAQAHNGLTIDSSDPYSTANGIKVFQRANLWRSVLNNQDRTERLSVPLGEWFIDQPLAKKVLQSVCCIAAPKTLFVDWVTRIREQVISG